jgi:hypothetical protein
MHSYQSRARAAGYQAGTSPCAVDGSRIMWAWSRSLGSIHEDPRIQRILIPAARALRIALTHAPLMSSTCTCKQGPIRCNLRALGNCFTAPSRHKMATDSSFIKNLYAIYKQTRHS